MKRVAAIALAFLVGLAVPAFAQHGGGGHGGGGGGFHGGGGGGFHGGGGAGFHGGGGFHGGFSAPRPSGGFSARRYGGFSASRSYRFAGSPRYSRPYSTYRPNSAYRSSLNGSRFRAPYRRSGNGGWDRGRGRDRDRDRDRDDRFRRHRFFDDDDDFPIPYWIGLGPYGCYGDSSIYGDDFGYGPDCYQQPPAQADQPVIYGDDQGDPPAPPPDYAPPSYQPPAYDPPAHSSAPATQIATTIVFKDGRPAQQIHNYALTQTDLYVTDAQRRDIPLDEIDVAATEKANRAAGIEFQVPESAQ
jgi:hypothetical protein